MRYTAPALAEPLAPPLQVFGVDYDLDVVLSTRNTGWQMHEYARIATPEGPVWLAKDADLDRVQTITTDRPDLDRIAAEIPVPRHPGPLRVRDASEGDRVVLHIETTTPRDEAVVVDVEARLPERPPRKRNGSTMGHSRQAVAAVLDLTRMGRRVKARVSIDGKRRRFARIAGLVPVRFLLSQAQGGIAVASYRVTPTEGGFVLERPGPDPRDPATGEPGWPTRATELWAADGELSTTTTALNRFEYRFVDGGLARATVFQVGRDVPVFELWLDPALPDLRRPFEGRATSRFRMDVNGQEGHGTGTVSAWWEDARTVALAVEPTAPWWLADRPMAGTIRYEDDGSVVFTMSRR